MVENAVQDNVHPARLHLSDQVTEGLLAAKHLIHRQIIGCIILVVGRRFKDRIEIEAGHAKGSQIIELFDNALQISSEKEIVFVVFFSVTQKFGEFFQISTKHRIFLHRVISRGKESIGKDLIKDPAKDPFRGGRSFLINEKLEITSAIAGRAERFGRTISAVDRVEGAKVRKDTILIEKESALCASAKLCHRHGDGEILAVTRHLKAVKLSRIVTKDLHLCSHGGFGYMNTEFHRIEMLKGISMGDVFSV